MHSCCINTDAGHPARPPVYERCTDGLRKATSLSSEEGSKHGYLAFHRPMADAKQVHEAQPT